MGSANMIETLKRYVIPIALFSLVPISSCTLIAEVDRGLINEGQPDASPGGTAGSAGAGGSGGTDGSGGTTGGTNGSGGTAGSAGTGGTAGSTGSGGTAGAPDDAPTSNDGAGDASELEDDFLD
jgi:hypothetical protein